MMKSQDTRRQFIYYKITWTNTTWVFNPIVYSLIFEIYNGFLVDSKDKICDTLNIQDLDLYIETIGDENFYEIDVNYFLSKLIFKDPKVMTIYKSSPYYFNFN